MRKKTRNVIKNSDRVAPQKKEMVYNFKVGDLVLCNKAQQFGILITKESNRATVLMSGRMYIRNLRQLRLYNRK